MCYYYLSTEERDYGIKHFCISLDCYHLCWTSSSSSEIMKVTYIEGACISEVKLQQFSLKCIMKHANLTQEELDAAKKDNYMNDATAITKKRSGAFVVVTVFDYDGEASFYIGPFTSFVFVNR